ncbi:MAG: glycosyltransferase family 9 protein [Blastochloris sp.]|nr:glycosyltransferase family 9 protein [Blastochloris sp.]
MTSWYRSDLVIMHKQLGDTVMLEPVLRKLHASSGRPVQLLCPRAFQPLIELMPHSRYASGRERFFPSRVWAYDWGGASTRASLLTICREKQLLLPNPNDVRRFHRITYSKVQTEPYLDRYIARYFWDHTLDDLAGDFSPPRLAAPPDSWSHVGVGNDEYLLFNPVSAWKRKMYPMDLWVKVLSTLTKELGVKIVMTGGREDWQLDFCSKIQSMFSGSMVNLAGQTHLKEFMHVISRARILLSVDGAASHLAAAFGRRCVTLFGPSYHFLWHHPTPLSYAISATDYSDEKRPATGMIPPGKVVQMVLELWNAKEV